ncbi:hypothetical protein JCM8547_003855 [Rhodosporidiobolus lusitaniae]
MARGHTSMDGTLQRLPTPSSLSPRRPPSSLAATILTAEPDLLPSLEEFRASRPRVGPDATALRRLAEHWAKLYRDEVEELREELEREKQARSFPLPSVPSDPELIFPPAFSDDEQVSLDTILKLGGAYRKKVDELKRQHEESFRGGLKDTIVLKQLKGERDEFTRVVVEKVEVFKADSDATRYWKERATEAEGTFKQKPTSKTALHQIESLTAERDNTNECYKILQGLHSSLLDDIEREPSASFSHKEADVFAMCNRRGLEVWAASFTLRRKTEELDALQVRYDTLEQDHLNLEARIPTFKTAYSQLFDGFLTLEKTLSIQTKAPKGLEKTAAAASTLPATASTSKRI